MQNIKIINQQNLIHNIQQFSDHKICAMVKCNAYGHGIKEIVKTIEDKVSYFGVVSAQEGKILRKLTKKPILICAKTTDYRTCKKCKLEIIVESEQDIKDCLKYGVDMHLKINCGMNRFGAKSVLAMQMINQILQENNAVLKSICTHFPCTQNKRETRKNYQNFCKLRAEITQNAPICFGGSGISSFPFAFDMLRLGIGMYGYGQKNLLPVMQITSYVAKITYAKKGEYIGYGKKFKVKSDAAFAVVPVGYGDGLRRNLSGKFCVVINQKKYPCFGNICMDAFFVKVDKNVKVGSLVQILQDATKLAKICHTIPYEILTGFSNFRGKTLLK